MCVNCEIKKPIFILMIMYTKTRNIGILLNFVKYKTFLYTLQPWGAMKLQHDVYERNICRFIISTKYRVVVSWYTCTIENIYCSWTQLKYRKKTFALYEV